MNKQQEVIEYLNDLYKHHDDMCKKAKVKISIDYHARAKRDISDTLKLIGKGKTPVWRAECYIEE